MTPRPMFVTWMVLSAAGGRRGPTERGGCTGSTANRCGAFHGGDAVAQIRLAVERERLPPACREALGRPGPGAIELSRWCRGWSPLNSSSLGARGDRTRGRAERVSGSPPPPDLPTGLHRAKAIGSRRGHASLWKRHALEESIDPASPVNVWRAGAGAG